jgi:hypothetical protein
MKELSLTVGGFYEALPAAAVSSDSATGAITKPTEQLIVRNNQGLIISD